MEEDLRNRQDAGLGELKSGKKTIEKLIKHIQNQSVLPGEVGIEGRSPHIRRIKDLLNGDIVVGAGIQKFQHRPAELLLGLSDSSIGHEPCLSRTSTCGLFGLELIGDTIPPTDRATQVDFLMNEAASNKESLMEPNIRIRDLKKEYVQGDSVFPALNGVTLDIDRGEFLAIVGRSGSGKSTLLHVIGGIDNPDSGQISVGQDNIATMTEDQRAAWRGRSVGVVFQFFQLIPSLTITENILLAMDLTKVVPKRQRTERANSLLEALGIASHGGKYPMALSGGQQQRAAIARALANDPDLLIADEPTGNLDSATSKAVLEIFADLNRKGKTIVLVTHERSIQDHVKRVVTIEDGKILSDETGGLSRG